MEIIASFYNFIGKPGVMGIIGSALKMTIILILAMVVIGLIASALEHIINAIIGTFLGSTFAIIFCNYLTFPGTILHELSHAALATLTGARVTEISFFDLSLTSLGHIKYRNKGPKWLRGIQDSLTACAPVISGVVALAILFGILTGSSHSLGISILLIYLIVCVIDHMTMSIPDIINYFRGILPTSILVFIINLIVFAVIS